MVFNPGGGSRYILGLARGFEQSGGSPDRDPADYFDLNLRAFIGQNHLLSGYYKKDNWGRYDFQRQFNIQFPHQFSFDYSYLLNGLSAIRSIDDEVMATRIGVRVIAQELDERSLGQRFVEDVNTYNFLTVFYVTYRF